MRPDVEVLREMLAEAEEEAVGFEAMATRAWALDEDERAEQLMQACATRQARARILAAEVARREPTGQVLGPVTDAPPDRVVPLDEVRTRLTLHTNPRPIRDRAS